MNTRTIPGRHVGSSEGMEREGDFYFADRDGKTGIVIWYPGETGEDRYWCHLSLNHGPALPGCIWGWNGDKIKPTLEPSIHVIDHWHGYLTDGNFVSC